MSQQNNVGDDMWSNMLANPFPAPANSSSAPQTSNPSPNNMAASGSGFAQFSGPNPFSQAPFYNPSLFNQPPPFYNPQQQQLYLQQLQFFQQQQQQPQPVFQQQQPPQPVLNNPADHVDSVASADDDVEVSKSPNNKKGKRVQVRWTTEEAVILAQRWIDASQNSVTGISQSDACFWDTIRRSYNAVVDVKRTKSQLNGKWTKIRGDVLLFSGILKKYTGSRHQSGGNDKDAYDAAHAHFEKVHGRKFIFEGCYHELKDYPKFWDDHGVLPNRRLFHEAHGTQEAPNPINLDEDESNPNPNPNPTPNPSMQALFRDDPIRRPPGRNVSRRTGSSSDATSSRHSSEESHRSFQQSNRTAEQALKTIQEAAYEKSVMDAMTFLSIPIPDGISKKQRKAMENHRQALWDKYVKNYLPNNDEDTTDDDE